MESTTLRVLFIGGDPENASKIERMLGEAHPDLFDVQHEPDMNAALGAAEDRDFDVALLDTGPLGDGGRSGFFE